MGQPPAGVPDKRTRQSLPGKLVVACSGTTTIKSDLVLDANAGAKLTLKQKTQAIDVYNNSQTHVRVVVLDKKERVISDMVLDAHDKARLDLAGARAVRFDNEADGQAVVHWTLRNDDRISYDLAMNPSTY
jgi:hypothetical protein